MRSLNRFKFHEPGSIPEASRLLLDFGSAARAMAGGTDLLVGIKEKGLRPAHVVNLKRIPDLAEIRREEDGGLYLGALVTVGAVEQGLAGTPYAVLAEAAAVLASVQVRNRATVGGNLCNASPSADLAPPLIALGAVALCQGPAGQRELPLEDFFQGPGQTALQPGELLVGLRLPEPGARAGAAYVKISPRRAMDIAVVGAAVALALEPGGGDRVQRARVVLGAVAPTPERARRAEALLEGRVPDPAALEAAAEQAMREARPITDLRASAEYRRDMVRVAVRRAAQAAWARAQGRS